MTVKFFPLFFVNDCLMAPAQVHNDTKKKQREAGLVRGLALPLFSSSQCRDSSGVSNVHSLTTIV
jgi:hypothetical protein